jgi:hypothetical protein
MHSRSSLGAALIAWRSVSGSIFVLTAFLLASQLGAQTTLGPITVGAGLQTGYDHNAPSSGSSSDQFQLESIRLYINGSVTDNIKFMFNTEYDGSDNKVGVLDAVAQIGVSPEFNIWFGRFLPPSDRANLYGPYYSNEYKVFTDGVQDGYPFIFQGRDNGIMYWGDFAKKVKVSAGVFDGPSADGNQRVIGAARVQIDFWDPEEGYYLNGTYYGDKNLLAIGGATQFQSGHTASSADFLLEKKVKGGGAVSVESEYANYHGLGGYDANFKNSQGAYLLGAYLFPKTIDMGKFKGKFQILGKFAKADFTDGTTRNYNQKTTEVDFNYIIKEFKARVFTFYKDTVFVDTTKPNFWQLGLGLQIQL